uniref:energy-coupling factor ABC transporter substrate-binding protein n=1 Tax=Azospirillum fermentarium TaxID=1233114 RepID=UPI002226A477|nr:energy-coupling factor ABC transporter substrate-binding protein [Azospirillum fermentarium]MCW2249097.1 cobalt/nickel transport protein [Azospirillum fermentarium]
MLRDNRIVLGLAAAIVLLPLVMPWEEKPSFGGSDDKASGVIEEVRPGYTPWWEPLWEPPSKEIESLLFAGQAAVGAWLLGYYMGRRSRRRDGDTGRQGTQRRARDARP